MSPLLLALVDECTDGDHTCHTHATCTDTVLSFTCACNVGYEGEGIADCTGNILFQDPINNQIANEKMLTGVSKVDIACNNFGCC